MPPPRQLAFADLAALYRAVLRANRRALPPPLRALGDGYAADEFRRHLQRGGDGRAAATTPSQWASFAGAWRDYVERLSAAPPSSAGGAASSASSAFSGDLPDEAVAAMSREQRRQLEQLRRAAEALARGDEGDRPEEEDRQGTGGVDVGQTRRN